MKLTCEIDRDAPLTKTERAAIGMFGLWIGAVVIVACTMMSGCKAFYENAGSHTKVGSLTAPVEVSDGSDSITVKALYSMDGADVYTAKDSLVKIRYRNAYTNNYFAVVKTAGVQDLEVEIEPLAVGGEDEAETNDVSSVVK